MGQIKKHKIKIFSEEHSSDFIVDLRENKKEIINPKLSTEKIRVNLHSYINQKYLLIVIKWYL